MKMWSLTPNPEMFEKQWPSYDCAQQFVVRAKDETQARQVASADHGDEGAGVWLDPACTRCEVVSIAGAPGVVARSYYGD